MLDKVESRIVKLKDVCRINFLITYLSIILLRGEIDKHVLKQTTSTGKYIAYIFVT